MEQEAGVISIHAPARGGDQARVPADAYEQHFNPRPREGGRHATRDIIDANNQFQSTPPRGGATQPNGLYKLSTYNFNPRPREGGRPRIITAIAGGADFNPRPREGGRQ